MIPPPTRRSSRAHAAAQRLAARRRWVALGVLLLPPVMVGADLAVVYLSAPHLAAALAPSGVQWLWIQDVHGFMLAASLLTMGTLGDRIGRRRLLLGGAAVFGLTSALVAYAPTAELLIAARALLGVAAATQMPSALAITSFLFAGSRQHGLAIGLVLGAFNVGMGIGWAFGGLLLASSWWGSVFLLAVPAAVVLLVVGPRLLPEPARRDAGRIDVLSAALLLAGVLALVGAVKLAAQDGVAGRPLLLLAAGAAACVGLVRRQAVAGSAALVDLRLFRSRAFTGALVLILAAFASVQGLLPAITQALQVRLGPDAAGRWLVTVACAAVTGTVLAALLARRIPPGWVISGGLATAVVGFAALTQADLTVGGLVPPAALLAAGLAPTTVLGTGIVVGAAPPDQAGAAAGLTETAIELGSATGVALLGSIGMAVYRGRLTLPEGASAAAARDAREGLGGALAAAEQLPDALGGAVLEAARGAFAGGLRTAALVGVMVAVCLAVIAPGLLRPAKTRPAKTRPAESLAGGQETGRHRRPPSVPIPATRSLTGTTRPRSQRMRVASRPDPDLRSDHGAALRRALAADPRVAAYLQLADQATGQLTEHGRPHAQAVAAAARRLLTQLGYPADLADLAWVAGYLHDIGNAVARHGHAQTGALLALPILTEIGLTADDAGIVLGAIGNHEVATGRPVSPASAAVIIADKTDVRASRVRDGADVAGDVHNRVHAATRRARLQVDPAARTVTFALTLDAAATVGDLVEALGSRLRLCGTAAAGLGCTFAVTVNGQPVALSTGRRTAYV